MCGRWRPCTRRCSTQFQHYKFNGTTPVGASLDAAAAVAAHAQLRPEPPPALKSDMWARDANETRIIGARAGSTRTEEQPGVRQAIGRLLLNGRSWAESGHSSHRQHFVR
jgi:hypothetical protein